MSLIRAVISCSFVRAILQAANGAGAPDPNWSGAARLLSSHPDATPLESAAPHSSRNHNHNHDPEEQQKEQDRAGSGSGAHLNESRRPPRTRAAVAAARRFRWEPLSTRACHWRAEIIIIAAVATRIRVRLVVVFVADNLCWPASTQFK